MLDALCLLLLLLLSFFFSTLAKTRARGVANALASGPLPLAAFALWRQGVERKSL